MATDLRGDKVDRVVGAGVPSQEGSNAFIRGWAFAGVECSRATASAMQICGNVLPLAKL